jgi:hypothetical protein
MIEMFVTNLWSSILDNNGGVHWHLAVIIILAALMGKNSTQVITTTT